MSAEIASSVTLAARRDRQMVDAAAVGLAGARMKKLTAEAQVDGMADGMIAEMMAAGRRSQDYLGMIESEPPSAHQAGLWEGAGGGECVCVWCGWVGGGEGGGRGGLAERRSQDYPAMIECIELELCR